MGFRCGTGQPNCDIYKQGQGCGRFHADPDIAGIGILTALVSTSLVNLTIGVLGHTLNVLRGYDDNAIDAWISRRFQSLSILRIDDKHKLFWRPIFEKVVLLLSDYQLLFGIAVLIAGFWKHCEISAYHFSLVVDLAWFSNTHMTSLSILRCYLRERPTLRNWRVTIMIFMGAMMLVALALASTLGWPRNLSCPVQCLFDEQERNFSMTYPYFVAIIIHYGTSIWRVYDTQRFDRFALQYPRERLRKIQRRAKRTNSNGSSKTRQATAAAAAFTFDWFLALGIRCYLAVAAILGSLTISLYYDIVWFAVGLTSMLLIRQFPTANMDGDENELSFGQIIPVLLLASIVLTFKEVYSEQKFRWDHEPAAPPRLPERSSSRAVNSPIVNGRYHESHEDLETGVDASRTRERPANAQSESRF
ncbi:MAG: hypothetical protein L6R36_006700 [Xanthoria steineri]|nr:MAG: hypothetical protein L6R36_006700 [Xanthoria steineri]